ncbi:MAG: hypothetical protein U1F22_03920 [Lysobacterales bacterium]
MDAVRRERRNHCFNRRGAGPLSLVAIAALAACSRTPEPPPAPRPPQAGQTRDAAAAAAHVLAARGAALRGDSAAMQQEAAAASDAFMRAARVPNPSRPIDREAARAAVRPLTGVRTAVWMDAANLIVMVDGQAYRNQAMIDRVCLALDPLGDTLAVVVNLQDVTAKNPDDATTLSRNCQLPEGQRAVGQGRRQIDAVSPELREAFKRQQGGKG